MTGPLHTAVVLGVRIAVLAIAAQAVLAGQFISGAAPGARTAHLVVGSVLELGSWVLLVLVACHGGLRRAARGTWLAALLLPVVITVQASLGHVPAAAATAVHVPLGVALLTWGVLLARQLPPARGARGADRQPAPRRDHEGVR